MKVAILAIVTVLVSVVLLGVRVLFVKGGRFPDGHVGHSAPLRRRGIGCAHSDTEVRPGGTSRSYNKEINNIINK